MNIPGFSIPTTQQQFERRGELALPRGGDEDGVRLACWHLVSPKPCTQLMIRQGVKAVTGSERGLCQRGQLLDDSIEHFLVRPAARGFQAHFILMALTRVPDHEDVALQAVHAAPAE